VFKAEKSRIKQFQKKLLCWYSDNRRVFPWRYVMDPYKVMVSEVLLQQTNASKVVEPFNIITNKYQSVKELAEADLAFLELIFADLGLFYRAERLIRISRYVLSEYNGQFPAELTELKKIPGIGDYSGSALLCFGFGMHSAVIDTNIIRIFSRYFDVVSKKSRPRTDKELWLFAESVLPAENYVDFNYALLDFAAAVCRHYRPICDSCVVNASCHYFQIQQIQINISE